MKALFCLFFFTTILLSCSYGNERQEFEFLEPDKQFTRNMIENGMMDSIPLGCVTQYMYEQNNGKIVAAYSFNGEEESIYECWVIELESKERGLVLDELKLRNQNASIIGPYSQNCEYIEPGDSCSYEFMIKNFRNNRIFSATVSYNYGDGEASRVLRQDIGWMLIVKYDHIIE